MNFSPTKFIRASLLSILISLGFAFNSMANNGYNEFDFVKEFSGKNAEYVLSKLGEPDQKQSRENDGGKVEFWVYKNIVNIGKSDKKYKYTQIGIVNDAVETLGNTNRELN